MAQQVVTELVIDADTSGADRFSQAMAGAEQAANSGVSSVTGFNVGLAALGTGLAGAVVGIKEMLDYVVTANKGLADMQTVAHQVGLTLTDFQGIQFGGQIAGLNTDQINAGLEKSASLLNDASRNSNSLSKELDANGISVKNANGQLISENQLLGVAANLIKNANNPQDQIVIAQMLGFTKEWVPLLEQGSTAMSGLAAEAKAAGAVIDDETIQKATDFDTQWRKSSVEFSTYMKAALSDLLPFVDDLIERFSGWLGSINKTKIQMAADQGLKDINGPLGIPEGGVIKIDDGQLGQGMKDFVNSPVFSTSTWSALGSAFASSIRFMSPEQASQSIPGFAASQLVEPSYPSSAQMDAAFDKASPPNPGSRSSPLSSLSASDYATAGGSIVASKDAGGGDAVDRAINQLQKHTQAQIADAQAVGLGDAALAGFKADAAETAAVMANGGKETDAQVDKFSDLKDAAIAAADALAKAKVASNIEFNTKTAFLSAEDVSIANQLKGIYGNDIPAALNSTYASAIRVNDAFKQVSSGIENNLVTGLTDIATGSVAAGQGFANMGLAVLKTIEQMIIKVAIVQPMMAALQNTISGSSIFGSLFGGLFGGGVTSSGAIAGAVGPTSVGGAALVGLHGGGIVGSEATFSRYVHPSYFDNAPKFHSGGIAGDEVPIIAQKGEGVFTPGQMAAMGGGNTGPNITYAPSIDARGADAQAVARLAQALADDRKNFERNVTATMAKYRSNNPGAR